MKTNSYDVFISYRREDGVGMAQLFHDRLDAMGYCVFLDLSGMRAGPFPDQLVRRVNECRDFVVVLSAKALRLRTEGDDVDWFRSEIAQAIRQGKNIIPVYLWDFDKKELKHLPTDIAALSKLQGVEAMHQYLSGVMELISRMLLSKRRRRVAPIVARMAQPLVMLGLAAAVGWLVADRQKMHKSLDLSSSVSQRALSVVLRSPLHAENPRLGQQVEDYTLEDAQNDRK